MEDDVVIVAALGEGREVLAGSGRVVVVELDDDGSLEYVSEMWETSRCDTYHRRLEDHVCSHDALYVACKSTKAGV